MEGKSEKQENEKLINDLDEGFRPSLEDYATNKNDEKIEIKSLSSLSSASNKVNNIPNEIINDQKDHNATLNVDIKETNILKFETSSEEKASNGKIKSVICASNPQEEFNLTERRKRVDKKSNINFKKNERKLNDDSLITIKKTENYYINYYSQLKSIFKNKFISLNDTNNTEILKFKAENNYYLCLNSFHEDLLHIILVQIDFYCSKAKNENIKKSITNYLYNFFFNLFYLVQEIFQFNCYRKIFDKDINSIIKENNLPKRAENSNYKNIPVGKEYQTIDEYKHIFPEITNKLVKTSISPKCEGTCCADITKLGPLNLEKGNWNGTCLDRSNNIECGDECACQETCKNQSFRKKDYLKLGEDVIQKYSWGIDLFTFRNLMEFLPSNFEDKYKACFIERVVIGELSNLNEDGWNIYKALLNIKGKDLIITTEETVNYSCFFESTSIYDKSQFKENIPFLVDRLIKVHKTSLSSRSSYTAYCKGLGIFCNRIQGIKSNQLIAPYYGEIYPQWYWYEKQDLIKTKNLDKELPDFYNIQLERLKTDPDGYNLVMIDPNSQGNFPSRMSHSCNPNSQTVTMISDNTYMIGMFAVKNVDYGEELTFDYNSITEKENEFKEAICLCGTYFCRGHYLIYSNGNNFNEILNYSHSFLYRNAYILKSIEGFSSDSEKTKVLEFLKLNSISESILNGCTDLIIKWVYYIVQYCLLENNLISSYKYITDTGIAINNIGNFKCSREKEDNTGNKTLLIKNLKKLSINPEIYKTNQESLKDTLNLQEQEKNNSFNSNSFLLNINTSLIVLKKDCLYSESKFTGRKRKLVNYNKENHFVDEFKQIPKESIKEKSKFINLSDIIKEVPKNYIYFAEGNKDSRIQNICITINKVNHILELFNSTSPPLLLCSNSEILSYLYGDQETSIKSTLLGLLSTFKNKGCKEFNQNLNECIEVLKLSVNNNLEEARLNLKKVSKIFYKSSFLESSKRIGAFEALSVILYFQSSVQHYFKPYEYIQNKDSVEIKILQRDISMTNQITKKTNFNENDLNKVIYLGVKKYDKMHIWGQMVGWFKQTVNKPESSLSSERRGTLVYPDLDSFFLSNIRINDEILIDEKNDRKTNLTHKLKSKIEIDLSNSIEHYSTRKNPPNKYIKTGYTKVDSIFNYPFEKDLNSFLDKLIESPSVIWPIGNRWNYKNRERIYGTVQFDSIYKEVHNYSLFDESTVSETYLKDMFTGMFNFFQS